jgi:DNA repair exonuclease SbcCD ATPase subunit
VNTRRPGRDDALTQDARTNDDIVLAAATLRGDARYPDAGLAHRGGSPEDRVSLFWRIFGGTILSIVALAAITLYNHQATSINELRAEINRLNEARAELVKKEEFNARTQNVWERVQSLQELRVTVGAIKEQLAVYGDKQGELKAVRESLAMIEQRLKSSEDDHKALARAELTITALEQKSAARDAQLKAVEDDRKEMVRQLQELRERLAKVEGATEVKPMSKSPIPKSKGD